MKKQFDYDNDLCRLGDKNSKCKKKECELWKDEEMCKVLGEKKGCVLDDI